MDRTNEEIFNFAYELALRDATIRTAFRGTTIYVLLAKDNPDTKYKATDDDKKRADCAKTAVRRYIVKIFKNELNTKDEHDNSFMEAVKEVINAFEGYKDKDSSFSFGNTQKLINMTAKYMFMATYNRQELRENFKCCHCPMDSVMMKEVAKRAGNLVDKEEKLRIPLEKFARKRPRATDWVPKDNVRWSKISFDNQKPYKGFQEVVRILAGKMKLSPLEFDFFVWGDEGDDQES